MGKQHVVSSARDFAVRAHGTQSYGDRSYAEHLDEVAVLVRGYGDTCQTVAYLHHVLDTEATVDQVEQQFGQLVASCVAALAADYATLAEITATDERVIALVVKAAERLTNLQACYLNEQRGKLRKYRQNHRDFRTAVFRPGVADELWREITDIIAS